MSTWQLKMPRNIKSSENNDVHLAGEKTIYANMPDWDQQK